MAKRKAKELSADEQQLETFKAWFSQDWQYEQEWRRLKREWESFYDGDQLSEEEKVVLKERGQPEVVINRIKPKIDGILGVELASRVMLKAFDRGEQDFETAKFVTEALRYVEYHTDFETQESLAFEDVLKSGRAWYEKELCWEDDELEPDILLKTACNDDMFLDRYCRQDDLSDAKHIQKSVWTDLIDSQELFPNAKEALEDAVKDPDTLEGQVGKLNQNRPDQYKQPGSDMEGLTPEYVDYKRSRLRLITTYYREPYRATYATAKGLGTQDITQMSEADVKKLKNNFSGVVIWSSLSFRLNVATWCASAILEKKTNIRPKDREAKFPFVLVPGYLTRGEKRIPYGYIKQMMDPQREVNKRRSKMLHLLNVNQILMEEGAVDDVEKTRREVARADGVVVYRKDFQFQIQRGAELANPHFSLLQESKSEIDEAGINREIQGLPSDVKSGRAIELRQQQATQVIRKLFSNLRAARRRAFELVLDDMQQHWTGEKLVRITDDPEAGKLVLNKRAKDPNTGEEIIINNLSLGKYDVILEEAPDTLNLQNEQFSELVRLAEAKLPIPADMIIEASSLPNKKQLLNRLQQQAQAQKQMQQQMLQAQTQGQGPGPQGQ